MSKTVKCPRCGCTYLDSEPRCPNCEEHGAIEAEKPEAPRVEKPNAPRRQSKSSPKKGASPRPFMTVYFIAAAYSIAVLSVGYFLSFMPGISPYHLFATAMIDIKNGLNPFAGSTGNLAFIIKGLAPFVFLGVFLAPLIINAIYAVLSLVALIKGEVIGHYAKGKRGDPNNSFGWFALIPTLAWGYVLVILMDSLISFTTLPSEIYVYLGFWAAAILLYIPITVIKNRLYRSYASLA